MIVVRGVQEIAGVVASHRRDWHVQHDGDLRIGVRDLYIPIRGCDVRGCGGHEDTRLVLLLFTRRDNAMGQLMKGCVRHVSLLALESYLVEDRVRLFHDRCRVRGYAGKVRDMSRGTALLQTIRANRDVMR